MLRENGETRREVLHRHLSARIWPVDGKTESVKLAADGLSMAAVAFRRDDRYLLTRSFDRTAAIWPVMPCHAVSWPMSPRGCIVRIPRCTRFPLSTWEHKVTYVCIQ